MAKVTFDRDKCKGCGLCVVACPLKIVEFSDKLNAKGFKPAEVLLQEKCSGCASCAIMCPDCVIIVEK